MPHGKDDVRDRMLSGEVIKVNVQIPNIESTMFSQILDFEEMVKKQVKEFDVDAEIKKAIDDQIGKVIQERIHNLLYRWQADICDDLAKEVIRTMREGFRSMKIIVKDNGKDQSDASSDIH